jgi:hypothetical protein
MRLSARRGQIAGWLPRSRSSGVEHSAGVAMALANILSVEEARYLDLAKRDCGSGAGLRIRLLLSDFLLPLDYQALRGVSC